MEPATCAVCHDPHGNTGVDKQLRFPLNAANLESNLCIKCHQRRGTSADAVSMGRNSVHSPEGPTLLGMAGWFPPGMSPADSLVATHGSSTKNPKLCATCHVQPERTDGQPSAMATDAEGRVAVAVVKGRNTVSVAHRIETAGNPQYDALSLTANLVFDLP